VARTSALREVIIVDDGSKISDPETLKVLKDLESSPYTLLRHRTEDSVPPETPALLRREASSSCRLTRTIGFARLT
jgi:hypothetical protein